ncbi:hypothetical protein DY000_02028814 [Brassica cretica]|uniref:Uncharacterized protein n=1 Tax=Brassica cretica TaxID=69181 RepID=A0ABQ7DYJ6_BRACR|nr:hypothetical protein DY000_02028814 [Brassica cretica]
MCHEIARQNPYKFPEAICNDYLSLQAKAEGHISGDSSTPLSPALFPGNGGSTAPVSPAFVPGKAVTLIALSFRRRLLRFVPELVHDLSFWLSVEESRRNRWVRWSQFLACSVETIGGFVFPGDVFSVPVAVV